MTYALSSIRQYNSKPPILLVFAIASIKSEVRSRVKRSKNHPYLLQYNCHPWAEHCFFVDDHSLASSMTVPLEPFVALSSFFTCQARSILDHPFRQDTTIQKLYSIAKQIFFDDITNQETITNDIRDFYRQTRSTMEKALTCLREDVPDAQQRIRVEDILNHGLATTHEYMAQHNESSVSSPERTLSPSATEPQRQLQQGSNSNWDYIESITGDNEVRNWESIFRDGKMLGYFASYSKAATMKSAYYRWKRRKRTCGAQSLKIY
ncbi:uncharacterized protein BX664DRAFT_320829 [Halteromyces radiatus]|uniref:uncharacterized protein n=1 Tax=Halteromyces radiatus TaxID=101107 RepID=UPI00221FCCD5|nr:uncharacterized protein BX664DRAFT_320829 [Halteromyces radiatus]KAI8099250.1 hypothetical protein BX664DRAFT_320829 [Halteromyces radiatus]